MRVKWVKNPEFGEGEVLDASGRRWDVRFVGYEHYLGDNDYHEVPSEELEYVGIGKPTPMEIVDQYYEEKSLKDSVNHPDHYNNGGIECIEYLKDNMSWQGYTGYLEGNCKKYLHRWRYKQKPIEDLKKARWYLDRLISELETEGSD